MDWTWGPADTWDATKRFLERLAATLSEPPKALLVVSAHWEEEVFTASTAARPKMIYDYYGFPEHTYKLNWPAVGQPALAERVAGLLGQAGLPAAVTPDRGFDHGVFVPLLLAFPDALIPTVSLSLATSPANHFDPALHLTAGRALASLREEGVLIIASGMSFHNLSGYLQPETAERARAFDAWLTRAAESPAPQRSAHLTAWREAPFAAYCHPREEHLISLMVAAGAGGDAPGKRIFGDDPMGAALSAYRFD
jgi:aromatic ring-opening dioxygenase catalytic subunit (LigB family)